MKFMAVSHNHLIFRDANEHDTIILTMLVIWTYVMHLHHAKFILIGFIKNTYVRKICVFDLYVNVHWLFVSVFAFGIIQSE